jgi:predicted NAD/FAD-dependent oxidoreductase
VRSEQFAALVHPLQHDGLVVEWCRGFGEQPDGHPRYVVRGGMNALAKRLAAPLDVRCNTLVFAIRRGGERAWSVVLDDASTIDADALVMTCPIPQSFSLLITAEVASASGGIPEALWRTDYDRTVTLLAVLDGPSGVRAPGGLQDVPGYTFVGDNAAKGISTVPALTLHTDPAWSLANWDADRDEVHHRLLADAGPWLGGARVIESQVKRWRYATPTRLWADPCWIADDERPLVLAGDAFAGPRVEGAVLSGAAAADSLLDRWGVRREGSGTLGP